MKQRFAVMALAAPVLFFGALALADASSVFAQAATSVPAREAKKQEAAPSVKPPVARASQEDVDARLRARKVVVGADGKEELADASAAKPGEVIEYAVTYTNKAKAPVRNLEATLPIPEGMQFVPQTAKPGLALASVDGVNFAQIPLKRKVKLPDGREVEREIPAAEYKSIRWKLGELAPGAASNVAARMRLNPLEGSVTAIK